MSDKDAILIDQYDSDLTKERARSKRLAEATKDFISESDRLYKLPASVSRGRLIAMNIGKLEEALREYEGSL